jgi:fumarylacetoacetase
LKRNSTEHRARNDACNFYLAPKEHAEMSLMKSWVASANTAETPFPLNNLPYGVFSTKDTDARCGVAIGDMILDVAACEAEGLISLDPEGAFDLPFWNDVMELGADVWAKLRARLVELLQEGSPHEVDVAPLLVSQFDAEMHLPLMVNEFTDFYAGKHHATNVGTMFRGPENALPPNWLHIPIGYNGRASTVVVSGTDITRPNGPTPRCLLLVRASGWTLSLRWALSLAGHPRWVSRLVCSERMT